MNYTGQTSFAEMFEYYCTRNVTSAREHKEREMMRWAKYRIQQARREGWEQAKREIKEMVQDEYCGSWDTLYSTIAAMEYEEKTK